MLRFRVTNVSPPGGKYMYTCPETGVYLEQYTMHGIMDVVSRHYRENGLQVPEDLQDKIMDYICRLVPSDFCFGDLDGRPRAKTLTLQQIKKNTLTLAAGNPRVIPGVARDRCQVCGKCPLNNRAACPSCLGLVSWARRLAASNLGAQDEWLGICEVDGTVLAAKICMSKIPDSDEYPATCWRKS